MSTTTVLNRKAMTRFANAMLIVMFLAAPLLAQQDDAEAKPKQEQEPQQEQKEKQAKAVNWRSKRILLNRAFGADLQELAIWCRAEGIQEQVEATFNVYREFGLDRQYIFLPTDKAMPVAQVKGVRATWLEKLNTVKVAHRTCQRGCRSQRARDCVSVAARSDLLRSRS